MKTVVERATSGSLFFFGDKSLRYWALSDPERIIATDSHRTLFVLLPVNDFHFRIGLVGTQTPTYVTMTKSAIGSGFGVTQKVHMAALFTWNHDAVMSLQVVLRNGALCHLGVSANGEVTSAREAIGMGFTMRCRAGDEVEYYFLQPPVGPSPTKKKPKKRLRGGSHSAESFVPCGMILITAQDDLYPAILLDCTVPSTASHNCISTEVRVGPPGREFSLSVILAVRAIEPGHGLRVASALPLPDMPPRMCAYWPKGETYFHGIGMQTAGTALLATPYNRLLVQPCGLLGDGEFEVVAESAIPAGTVFVYGGEISRRLSPYSWESAEGTCVVGGSVLRYVNVYFGFATEPNAVLTDFAYHHTQGTSPVLCVAIVKDVPAGHPVLVASYGRGHDYEILRKSVCRGKYLPPRSFPAEMLLPGMKTLTDWFLPGDVVLIKSTKRVRKLKLFILESVNPVVRAMPLAPPDTGVCYTLPPDVEGVSLNLMDSVLLVEGADYEMELMDGKKKVAKVVHISQFVHCKLLQGDTTDDDVAVPEEDRVMASPSTPPLLHRIE